MNQITIELHNMVTRAIQEALSASKPSSDSVRKMMTDLQGPCSLNAFLDSKNVPYADLSYTNGMPSLLAAFAVLRGGSGIPQVRAYLQFYAQVGGVWELRTETGSEFDDTAFSVARIRSGASNESWYLVWGGVIGDTGARRKVRLYGFDGYAVRTIWQRDDLRGANISVSGAADKVTIEHNSYPPEGVLAPPRRIVDVMRATVNGLILESSRVVPDPAPIERK